MKCPICGCKMKEEFMCPFCKITGEQVREASNKEAIKRIKNKDTKEVYNSSYLPKDVNNTKLFVMCLLGGYVGIPHMHVGRYKTGLFYLFATIYTFVSYALSRFFFPQVLWLDYAKQIGYILGAIVIFCWISNVLKVLFKTFTIPVVLAEVQYRNKGKKR